MSFLLSFLIFQTISHFHSCFLMWIDCFVVSTCFLTIAWKYLIFVYLTSLKSSWWWMITLFISHDQTCEQKHIKHYSKSSFIHSMMHSHSLTHIKMKHKILSFDKWNHKISNSLFLLRQIMFLLWKMKFRLFVCMCCLCHR